MSTRELVVGTRASALALAQTDIVCRELQRVTPQLRIRVERITTTGDRRTEVPLSELGRGIFVTELESALREGRIDLAVHSAKDLPSTLASDLSLGAIVKRGDARDVLVSKYGTVRELPVGARVGTSSPRRACQLRALRADLVTCDVRGNVDTRLRKLAAGDFDAIMLAAAGLVRLGRESEITEWFEPATVIPSVGQGALAVEVRGDDARTLRLVAPLDDADTRAAVIAERAFLAELGAGCRAVVGAYARVDGDRLHILALIGATDGRHVGSTRSGPVDRAAELGVSIARELLRDGGAAFLTPARSALVGKGIAITRPTTQSADLIALLAARGANVFACPAVAIEPMADHTELDAALADLASVNWIVFSSVNAVHAVADRMRVTGARLPVSVMLAAVGSATADAVATHIRSVDFVPSHATGKALADELPDVKEHTVLFPRGDLAGEIVALRLGARGASVREVTVYRTVPGEGIGEFASRVRDGEVDAAVFMSPSSIRFSADVLCSVEPPERPAIICIGPTTTRAARAVGLAPDAEASTQSIGGVIEALEHALTARVRVAPSPN